MFIPTYMLLESLFNFRHSNLVAVCIPVHKSVTAHAYVGEDK